MQQRQPGPIDQAAHNSCVDYTPLWWTGNIASTRACMIKICKRKLNCWSSSFSSSTPYDVPTVLSTAIHMCYVHSPLGHSWRSSWPKYPGVRLRSVMRLVRQYDRIVDDGKYIDIYTSTRCPISQVQPRTGRRYHSCTAVQLPSKVLVVRFVLKKHTKFLKDGRECSIIYIIIIVRRSNYYNFHSNYYNFHP